MKQLVIIYCFIISTTFALDYELKAGSKEAQNISRAILLLKKYGKFSQAAMVEGLIDLKKLWISDDLGEGGLGLFNQVTGYMYIHKIIALPGITTLHARPYTEDDPAPILANDEYSQQEHSMIVQLASVLYHEAIHAQQNFAATVASKEVEAWSKEIIFHMEAAADWQDEIDNADLDEKCDLVVTYKKLSNFLTQQKVQIEGFLKKPYAINIATHQARLKGLKKQIESINKKIKTINKRWSYIVKNSPTKSESKLCIGTKKAKLWIQGPQNTYELNGTVSGDTLNFYQVFKSVEVLDKFFNGSYSNFDLAHKKQIVSFSPEIEITLKAQSDGTYHGVSRSFLPKLKIGPGPNYEYSITGVEYMHNDITLKDFVWE